jgi:NADH:ubiquinone oxidoreductase subunit 5 (subunit L)/multisubunit Na+/H+ antiporter MnhA subunit
MGAGSILHGAGTRNLNQMGGLLRRMPHTGLLLIVGAMAVSALPPMNGLVGEWFIYRGLLEGGIKFQGLAAALPLVLVGLMAMIGAMVLVVMVRMVGIGLSGEARYQGAATAHEANTPMLGSMTVIALLCLAGGLLPALLIDPALSVAATISPSTAGLLRGPGALPYWLGPAGIGMVLVALAILAGTRLLTSRRRGVAPTWGCGFLFPSARMSYSADSFSELAHNSFYCDCLRPKVTTGVSGVPGVSGVSGVPGVPGALLPGRTVIAHEAGDFFLQSIYLPLFQAAATFCSRMRGLQSGLLHLYIFYVFCTMILLLGWLVLY